MPTSDLAIQGPGRLAGYSAVIGAPSAYQALDDSADTTHDSDDSYIVLAGVHRLLATNATVQTDDGDGTFLTFVQGVAQDFAHQPTAGILPAGEGIAGVRVTWVARDPQANGDLGRAGLKIGAARYFGDQFLFDAGGYMTLASDFLVDPSDGGAWTAAKCDALQSTVLFDSVIGTAPRLTMVGIDIIPPATGIVSFPLFLMAERMDPDAITLRVAAKAHSGSPSLQIGFSRPGGALAFHGTPFTPGAAYAATTRTFSTNPFTAAAWGPADLVGLEACLKASPAGGSSRITLLNGSSDFVGPHNYDPIVPHAAAVA